jgi:Reverse transcriptase (RNA-dependent DNA polymerase)
VRFRRRRGEGDWQRASKHPIRSGQPAFRFYLLYDKVCREDILAHGYRLARANAGAPGVDGVTFAQIEAEGVDAWLASLREELALKTYRSAPVRRVMIPKPGGGERPLGIPTIRDRVVQTAAKLVLEPIFEADFDDGAYGYRPGRSATDAIKEVHRLICRGYTDVVDADLSKLPKEVEALRPCVLHRGLSLVERQPELRHHRLCPRQSRSRISLAEDYEVIGIVDDVRAERLAAAAASPMLEEAVHVNVGKQRTRDTALRRAVCAGPATTHARFPLVIPFFDRRFQPQLDQP